MKKYFLSSIVGLLSCLSIQAQTIITKDKLGNYSESKPKTELEAAKGLSKTQNTYTTTKGDVYAVYLNDKSGKRYTIRKGKDETYHKTLIKE